MTVGTDAQHPAIYDVLFTHSLSFHLYRICIYSQSNKLSHQMQELHEDSHILFVFYTPRCYQSICTLWDVCHNIQYFHRFTSSNIPCKFLWGGSIYIIVCIYSNLGYLFLVVLHLIKAEDI